jgi:uncharacterized RDD family membrane protein YckC
MNTQGFDSSSNDVTTSGGNKIYATDGVELPNTSESPYQTEEEQKNTYSRLKTRQLQTLRSATAPRDSALDKTVSLPREERLGKPLPPLPEERLVTTQIPIRATDPSKQIPRPWHRVWARFLDNITISFIAAVPPAAVKVAYAAFGVEHGAELGVALTALAAVICGLLYEPFMLSMFGTTLGKGAFKIRISDQRTGQYLSFGRAIQRMLWLMWYTGQFLFWIPLLGSFAPLIGTIMQYKKLLRDKITSYDERMRIRVEHG